MIEEKARVLAAGPGVAWVETARKSACGACSASSGCGAALVVRVCGGQVNRLQVTDDIGLEVGDAVVIGIADHTLIRASLLAYLWPLATLMLSAFIAEAAGASEEFSVLAGILGLCAGLWVVGRLTGGASGRVRYRPVVLRRTDPSPIAVPMGRIANS